MRRRATAFTLVELLVVIGVILVLMGIVALGFRHLNKVAAQRDTLAELHVCRDLLTEYEKQNGLQNLEDTNPPVQQKSSGLQGMNGKVVPFPIYLDTKSGNNPTPYPDQPIVLQPSDVSNTNGSITDMGDRSSATAPRYGCNAVVNTRSVMYVLMRMPRNRTTVAGLPTKRLLEPQPGYSPNGQSNTIDPSNSAVLLDGWGNPIIFVPRGGMHVFVPNPGGSSSSSSSATTDYIVRSSGMFPYSQISSHPLGPNDRPFFASAGEDGKFATDPTRADGSGADNVYSFQD